jgi:hypothetical protein
MVLLIELLVVSIVASQSKFITRTSSVIETAVCKLLGVPVNSVSYGYVHCEDSRTHNFLIAPTTVFVNGDTFEELDIVTIDLRNAL